MSHVNVNELKRHHLFQNIKTRRAKTSNINSSFIFSVYFPLQYLIYNTDPKPQNIDFTVHIKIEKQQILIVQMLEFQYISYFRMKLSFCVCNTIILECRGSQPFFFVEPCHKGCYSSIINSCIHGKEWKTRNSDMSKCLWTLLKGSATVRWIGTKEHKQGGRAEGLHYGAHLWFWEATHLSFVVAFVRGTCAKFEFWLFS